MREIKFTVRGQQLARAKADGEGPIVRGTRGYLRCRFILDNAWKGMRIAAAFYDDRGAEHAAELEDGACYVPAEVTGGKVWSVALVGADGDARVTTNRCRVYQEAM